MLVAAVTVGRVKFTIRSSKFAATLPQPMRPPAPPLRLSENEGPAREKICSLVNIQTSKFLSARICALRPLHRVEDRLAADRALLRSYSDSHDDLTPGGAHWQFEADIVSNIDDDIGGS
jgi:hypothetical protein